MTKILLHKESVFSRINDAVSLLRLYAIMHPDSKLAEYDFSDTNPHDLIQVISKDTFKIEMNCWVLLGIYQHRCSNT